MSALARRLLVLALAGAAACSGVAVPVPVTGVLRAAERTNLDVTGRPSPVAVKVYQLKEPGSFTAADFFSLWRSPSAALEADLVSTTDLAVSPGQEKRFTEEIEPSARFVGVVAAFREIEQSRWRAVVPVPDDDVEDFAFIVKVENLDVTAHFGEAE